MMILGVFGPSCSGKSTTVNILKEMFEFKTLDVRKRDEQIHFKQKNFENLSDIESDFEDFQAEEMEDKLALSEKLTPIKKTNFSEMNTVNARNLFQDTSMVSHNSIKEHMRDFSKYYVIVPFSKFEHYKQLCLRTNFRLLHITSSAKRRYQFYKEKNGETTVEEFLDFEDTFSTSEDYLKLMEVTNYTLNNNGSKEDLINAVKSLFNDCLTSIRPDWDDYFMKIAQIVANRSNCIKTKVGCIVVKNCRILSTGYNGTPFKLKNCISGACLRCKGKATQGEDLDKCICIHAEENCVVV